MNKLDEFLIATKHTESEIAKIKHIRNKGHYTGRIIDSDRTSLGYVTEITMYGVEMLFDLDNDDFEDEFYESFNHYESEIFGNFIYADGVEYLNRVFGNYKDAYLYAKALINDKKNIEDFIKNMQTSELLHDLYIENPQKCIDNMKVVIYSNEGIMRFDKNMIREITMTQENNGKSSLSFGFCGYGDDGKTTDSSRRNLKMSDGYYNDSVVFKVLGYEGGV